MTISTIRPERTWTYQLAVFGAAMIFAGAVAYFNARSPRSVVELQAEDAIGRGVAPKPHSDVVIVALDDAAVTRYGPVKAWRRSLLADGLRDVESGHPRSVIMDMALEHRTNTNDAALWRVIADNRNVVLGMPYDSARTAVYTPDDIRSLVFLEKYAVTGNFEYDPTKMPFFPYGLFEPPVSDFTGSSRGVGVFDRESDADGVVRNARLIYLTRVDYPVADAQLPHKFPESRLANGSPVALPNLALVAALRAFDLDKTSVHFDPHQVRLLGNVTPPVSAPVDDVGRMNIRYSGPAGTFPRIAFTDLIDRKADLSYFKNKDVLFGATALHDAATDARSTPFQGLMPRVEVTANALSTILNRSYVGRYEASAAGTICIVGFITGLLLMFVSGLRSVLVSLGLAVVFMIVVIAGYAFGGFIVPILPGLAIILLTCLASLALYAGPCRTVEVEVLPAVTDYSPKVSEPAVTRWTDHSSTGGTAPQA